MSTNGTREAANCPSLVDSLRSTLARGGRPESVELVETHISWILLTERFVYKVKKAVRFDF